MSYNIEKDFPKTVSQEHINKKIRNFKYIIYFSLFVNILLLSLIFATSYVFFIGVLSIFAPISFVFYVERGYYLERYKKMSFSEIKRCKDKIVEYPELYNKYVELYKKQNFIIYGQEEMILRILSDYSNKKKEKTSQEINSFLG